MDQVWEFGDTHYSGTADPLSFVIKFCDISSPHCITLTMCGPDSTGPIHLPFKEVEYLALGNYGNYGNDSPIDFHHTLDHMEFMIYDSDQQRPTTPLPTPPPFILPLFNALRVLVMKRTNPSFLGGHTFHKLEKCRVVTPHESDNIQGYGLFTEMPVCTRLDIDDLTLLSTFKLPHIHELAVEFRELNFNMVWEKQIVVNTNLSGLKLLHMRVRRFLGNLDQILKPLQSLETLILSFPPGVECFGSLLPLCSHEASGLKQSSSEGRSPAILCPMLQGLHIEASDPSGVLRKSPILKDIVIQRAVCGSPLKSFTFLCALHDKGRSKSELIESDGSFIMEERVLAGYARRFMLDI